MGDHPIVQLYCKRLTLDNVEAFVSAEPDHIGWQLNLAKLDGGLLEAAVDVSGKVAARLKACGIVSVFLIHPSDDYRPMVGILERGGLSAFVAVADRLDEVDPSQADAVRVATLLLRERVRHGGMGADGDPWDAVGAAEGACERLVVSGTLARAEADAFRAAHPSLFAFVGAVFPNCSDLRTSNWMSRDGVLVLNDPRRAMTHVEEAVFVSPHALSRDDVPRGP